MQTGDIYRVLELRRYETNFHSQVRYWVAFPVTKSDIRKGTNTHKTGLHGFGGFWYGTDAKSRDSYGKICPVIGAKRGTIRRHPSKRFMKFIG